MKTNMKIKSAGMLVVAFFAALALCAQTNEINDEDLLELLQTVSEETNATEMVQDPVTEEIQAVAEPAEEILELSGDTVSETKDTQEVSEEVAELSVLDDLVMSEVENDLASSSDSLISVRLNKVGLEEAINLFAQLSGANIIVPELTEAAQISVNLKDVEWRPALQSILDTYNYELYQRVAGSNVFSVRRRAADAPEPQVVETFMLKYATVPNAAVLIRELLPDNAKVSEFASRNMIVVKSTESSLGEVRAVLSAIDKVRQQVFIESKFMELTDDAQKDLGVDWQLLSDYSIGASANAAAYGKEISTATPSENLFTDLTGGAATFAGSGEYAILTSVLNADDFNLVLSALEENKGVNVVSNPKIIVANEEQANISIIRREPNLKQSRTASVNPNAQGDGDVVFELDTDMPFFEYGITLDVTPSINTSSNITVRIQPSLTRFFKDKTAGDTSYPIIDEKSIQTVFNLSSGQTAAIGGLTEVTEGETERKVPLLGSLPLLGKLFSWKQSISGQSETIIFVTVGLANTQEIDSETGMPSDAELARRQVIQDRNSRKLRDQTRAHFETQETEKLDDLLKRMQAEEQNRLNRREKELKKEAKKAIYKSVSKADVASSN
ncbi:MAG: hypothetical protein HKP10_01825 [Kiritimatiellales bacterium]|nr:hypothetical protein [Kiritimatiellales bacterium]